MKEKTILFAFSEINDEYIEGARPKGKRKTISRWAMIAACVMLVCGLSLWSITFGSGGGSDYVQNPQFLAAVQDYLFNSGGTVVENDGAAPGDPGGGADDSFPNGDYMEITDNQVEGVVEGDLAKATEKYLFRLGSHTIYIYSINGESSALVSTYTIPFINGEMTYYRYYDMFLSSDGCTLTLFCKYEDDTDLDRTIIMSIDVSDVTSPKEKNRVVINGSPAEVRRIGNEFYLITNWLFEKNQVDLDSPESFIPSIDYAEQKHICQSDKIIFPEQFSRLYYTYLTVLDEDSLSLSDELAMMVSGNVYFSENNIIFDSQYTKSETEGDKTVSRCYSKISVLDISDGLKWRGDFTIKGWVKDQYSFNERDGVLRIVASLSDRAGYIVRYDSASLYIYDLDTMSEIASVEEFAPYGEAATAVRFECDKLYVCTAEIVTYTDPVYFFDLSDYSNITYADTGYIDGFSSSLIDLGEGYLLGVGREDPSNSKLEVYRREGDGVVSVDKFVFGGSIETEYKSYLINREENLFGFGVSGYTNDGSNRKNVYLVVRFDGKKLTVLSEIESSTDYSRAFCNNGYIYLTLPNTLRVADGNGNVVADISTLHQVGEWTTVTPASCGERAIIEAQCSCGRVITKTDYSNFEDFVNHQLEGGICTVCGIDLGSPEKNAEMIIYTSLGDGTCFVSGTKERLMGIVQIPSRSPKGDVVKGIGKTAFMYCGITEIKLPDSIEYIDDYAFYSTSLTSIDINRAERIGNGAFTQCQNLTDVNMSKALKSIGHSAFKYCEKLEQVIIPDSVTEIGERAFESCDSLRSVKLPDGLKVISRATFNLCYGLFEVEIPDSVTVIEEFAFNHCRAMLTITIPDSVTSIGERAFQACEGLIQIVLGKRVNTFGDFAFKECISLTEIVNRSSLDIRVGSTDHGEIGKYAKSVVKGDSNLEVIGEYMFYRSEGKNILSAYLGDDTEIYLPTLADGAEYEIGPKVFYQRDELTAVYIPEGVTAIGKEAFRECNGIASMTLPDSMTVIGESAFLGCDFTSFDMGDGVVTVDRWAFRGCGKLESIAMSQSLETIGEGAFSMCYKVDLEIPASVREIGIEAFSGCFALSKAVIPEGATVIREKAFDNCHTLSLVVIPESVVEVKEGAFYACPELRTICYRGSEEQWNNIILANNNGIFKSVKITFNYK